jgi:hypothetical protein
MRCLYLVISIFKLPLQADLDDGDFGELVVPGDGLPHLSPDTVGDYMAIFRDMIGDYVLNLGNGMVGGPGTTCEIDESMFGDILTLLCLSHEFLMPFSCLLSWLSYDFCAVEALGFVGSFKF